MTSQLKRAWRAAPDHLTLLTAVLRLTICATLSGIQAAIVRPLSSGDTDHASVSYEDAYLP